MKKYRVIVVMISTIIYIIGQEFFEDINTYYDVNMGVYIYILLPALGIIYGFLFSVLNFQFNQSKKEKSLNVILLIFFLIVYYLPIIPNLNLYFSYFLLMSSVRKYVCPFLCGVYLHKSFFAL